MDLIGAIATLEGDGGQADNLNKLRTIMSNPDIIDHEIRIRQIENKLDENDKRSIDHQDMIKGNFNWIVGTVITSISGLVLHAVKLI